MTFKFALASGVFSMNLRRETMNGGQETEKMRARPQSDQAPKKLFFLPASKQ